MRDQKNKQTMVPTDKLPPIPEKRYFTIGEVSELCHVKPHVLRYWEQEFAELKPSKRRGNRRYYQNKDILLIRQIRSLLYEQGYTIQGAAQSLNRSEDRVVQTESVKTTLRQVIAGLESLKVQLGE